MSNDVISISQLAKQLGISYQGALKKIKSNQDALQPFIVYGAKGNIKGIKPDAMQVIYNLPYRATKQDQEPKQMLASELMLKDEIIKAKQDFIDELIKDKEEMRAKILSLETELDAYRKGGIFTRLLGYKKR